MCVDAVIDGIHYYLEPETGTAMVEEHPYAGMVVIPDSVTHQGRSFAVTEIDDEAFAGCDALTAVFVPSSIVWIGREAFAGCQVQLYIDTLESWMNTDIDFEIYDEDGSIEAPTHNLPYVASALFVKGQPVEELKVPEGITQIKKWQFYGWQFLTSLETPDAVSRIGYEAFLGCEGLKSVTLGCGIKEISARAFGGLKNLTEFCCLAEDVPTVHPKAFDGTDIANYATLYVPSKSVDKYKAASPWNHFHQISGI